jgi:hypothetical protein
MKLNLDISVSTEFVILKFILGGGGANMRKKKSPHLQGIELE